MQSSCKTVQGKVFIYFKINSGELNFWYTVKWIQSHWCSIFNSDGVNNVKKLSILYWSRWSEEYELLLYFTNISNFSCWYVNVPFDFIQTPITGAWSEYNLIPIADVTISLQKAQTRKIVISNLLVVTRCHTIVIKITIWHLLLLPL